ncbi:hypothetical protein EGW08_001619 [Elysia chlorotica]|uniref:Reverse transcriptase domain-containing protein n=1 Tax=Elysia chlorotica TaxID=188477 RepID=A0A433U9Z6_ELYCH|nr:hypothetical protein EGW08_001619 [Elysia chlorotica]
MINGTWRRSLLDVRVMRGADVGSDHHLVMATLRLKLRRCGPRPSGQRRFDVDKLKDNKTRSSFVLQPVKRKEWISAETWKTIEDRKDLKRKVMDTKSERMKEQYREHYREADKTVKRKTRADKRAFIDDLASQAEEAAGRGEQGKVYKITKIVAGKYRGTSNAPITDKQGRLLTTESEQEARWTEHFREILNRPPPTAEADIHFAEVDLDINTEPPEEAEIERAIKSLKSGKAPGQDNLNAELFKDWAEGVIVMIPKKGDRSDCNNWRGITLLSIPSKILSKIIIQRISEAVDQQLRNEQAGFRKGGDAVTRYSPLEISLNSAQSGNDSSISTLWTLRRPSTASTETWRILDAYRIPEKKVLIIKSFYSNFRLGHETNNRWNLFSTLEDLDFADDLALLSHTHNHMQEKTARLSNFAKQVGLKINKKKTEVMMLNISNQSPIEVNGENFPTTEEFTYLGSKVRHDGGAGTDIQSRLSKARNSFRMLNNVWRSSQYEVKTKLRLYQSCVLSTLLYGSECWRMTQSDLNKLSTFHTKNLRRILRISWPETISNQHLLARCNQLCMDR